MVCFLTSLREVAPELHSPGLDAVMVRIETLGQAPEALDHLDFHIEFSDWRVLNRLQVREAALLARALFDAEQALARFRLALYMLSAAMKAVQSAAGSLRQHYSRPVRSLGREALRISVEGAIGSDAQLQQIDLHLVAVRAARAPPTLDADEILQEMDKALVFLRRANRRLQRGLEHLDEVAARFHDLRSGASRGHALTRAAPPIAAVAMPCCASLRRLMRIIRDSTPANFVRLLQLVAGRRQELRARTATPFEFDFRRYTGPLEVRSRRDVAEAFALSRPHAQESGIPSRRVVLVIGGVNSLPEADAMRQDIQAGVEDRGWVVHGLTSLSTVQALHTGFDLLDAAIDRLLKPDVMDDDSLVHDPSFFAQAELIARDILRLLSDDATVAIPELRLLAENVLALGVASRAPPDAKNPLRTAVHMAQRELRLDRDVAVVFVAP